MEIKCPECGKIERNDMTLEDFKIRKLHGAIRNYDCSNCGTNIDPEENIQYEPPQGGTGEVNPEKQPINDGGPAFPHEKYEYQDGDMLIRVNPSRGMSLRDYFAGQALVGLSSNQEWMDNASSRDKEHDLNDVISHVCYCVADAMIKEREK